jgi:hypothetical protein
MATQRKKKTEKDVKISIAVVCSPRDDELAFKIIQHMAEAAARLLPPADAQRLRDEFAREFPAAQKVGEA